MAWAVPGYREVRALGGGATGRVVLATHEPSGTSVAIKYLSDTSGLATFRAEARLLCALDNPNVVRLWEYVEQSSTAAIVMELVNGVTLREMLRRQSPTEPEAALCVLKGSLLGLAAAHVAGVVHRDYKPENVLVDLAGESKLADFGIATRSGRSVDVAGTPSYMAPEQWRGEPAGPASDIYAATATFVECLTGRPPFAADDVTALRRQHENAPVPLDGLPSGLRSLAASGLAKSPSKRPPDAAAFLAALEEAAVGAYGEDWERRGKARLARRVALLALLLPLGGAAVGGSAFARTVLGPGRWAFAAGLLALLLAGGVGASGLTSSDSTTGPPTAVTPRPAPSSAPLATPTPSPSASPSPQAPPPTTASTTQSTVPAQPPPPPPASVVKLLITKFEYQSGTIVQANVHVITSNTSQVTLTVRFAGSNNDNIAGSISPDVRTFVLSGATSYDWSGTIDGSQCYLAANWVGVQVSTSPAAQGGGPFYLDQLTTPC